MKLFNKLFKKKEEPKKKYTKDSVYGKWEDGLISADDVMLLATCNFYKYALDYMWHINSIKEMVWKHNEEIPKMKKLVDEVISEKNPADRGLNTILLQLHKNDKKDEMAISNGKGLLVLGGSSSLNIIDSCKEIRDDAGLNWSKESIIHYCSMEGLREVAIEEKVKDSSTGKTKEDFIALTPTEEQLGLFYDACALNCRMSQKAYEEGRTWDVDSLFTDEWILQLPDEDGVYHVVEENYLAEYIEMDYKGVV